MCILSVFYTGLCIAKSCWLLVKGMLEDLQWRTLEQRRADCRLVLLFQIIHGLVQIPPTNYLQP